MAHNRSSANGADKPPVAPTSAMEWRNERRGVVKTLLSGKRVRLRAVDISLLLLQGDIPDLLTPQVIKMFFGDTPDNTDELTEVLGISKEHLPVVNLICRAAFVEPRIVDEPQADDEIAIDDVDLLDRMAVYRMVTQGLEALRRFRLEPYTDVETVPDEQDGGAKAEPDVSVADLDAVGSLPV